MVIQGLAWEMLSLFAIVVCFFTPTYMDIFFLLLTSVPSALYEIRIGRRLFVHLHRNPKVAEIDMILFPKFQCSLCL